MAAPLPPALAQRVSALSPARRLAVGAVAVALAVLAVVGGNWAGGPSFVSLYRDLELGAAGAVTDNLAKAGIAYRLAAGGTEVLVPEADLARARVALARDGLPRTGRPGMELFDQQTWGMTDFTQRITYRRALEGELARTIGGLRGVERAQVHLALPEQSALRRLEKPAEAAVVVTVRPGQPLGPEAVQGITHLVSNAVEGLPPDNVAVMDDTGRLLSTPQDPAGLGLTSRQLELQREVEQQLTRKADELLVTVLGTGQAKVAVAAQLNLDQQERSVELYDPDRQVLTTEQRSEGYAPDGDPGAGAQTIVSNQYANSRTLERTVGAIGTVRRLSVSVLVDEAAVLREAARGTRTPDQQVAALETALRAAVGIDSARGDRLTVTALPFGPPVGVAVSQLPADSAPRPSPVVVAAQQFGRPLLVAGGLVLAFVLAWRAIRPPTIALPAALAAGGGAGALAGAAGAAGLASGDAVGALPPPEPEVPSASQVLRKRVQQDSMDRPEVAAQVMRAWLAEGGA